MTRSQDPRQLRRKLHSARHSRQITTLLVAAMVISLVLMGSVPAFAQTPTPKVYGPLTPAEQELYDAAEANIDAFVDPLTVAGYYVGRLTDEAATGADAVAATPAAIDSWATNQLCKGSEQCLVGDFNGDGRDDVAVAIRDTQGEPARGDINVALSTGVRFQAATKWADLHCTGGQVCKVGDVNADGAADIIAFNRGAPGQPGTGNVFVALSTKTSFAAPTLWHSYFCINNEVCEVGNVDGRDGDDIIAFVQGTDGDVYVARSNGFHFIATEKWHDFFCIGSEECHAADVTGDGRADAILFVKTGSGKGRVTIAPSDGTRFVGANNWDSYFCVDNEQCATGDFDGNGIQDILAFIRDGFPGSDSRYGDVWVNLSVGSGLSGGKRWNDMFCLPGQDCAVGDFNADGRDDVIAFVKTSGDPNQVGQALVALATGSPTGFVPTPGLLWLQGFCPTTGSGATPGASTCATGDFNGDGLDDAIYFVRSTQTGLTGKVFVALSTGTGFTTTGQPWNFDDICVGTFDICRTGDVDNDGDDDIIVFSRLQQGVVYVERSLGNSFGPREVWNTYFCVGQEWCDVGDYNGDGLTDIALFTRSAYGSTDRAGDVEVALSNGGGFIHAGLWHTFFCIGNEWCMSGDVNGDGADDLIGFAKGSVGSVYVELSLRYQFGDRNAPAEQWEDFFCAGNEICDVGDYNGDNRDDIVSFLRTDYPSNPVTYGDVYVGLSTGSAGGGGFAVEKWNEYFCIAQETCVTGKFNNDGREDIGAFTRGTAGNVYVSLATIGTPFAFVPSNPPPLNMPYKNWLPMLTR